MDGFCLTDWRTIISSGSTVFPTQSAEQYLDLGPYEDAVFYLDVAEATASATALSYQTSPSKDDASFLALFAPFTVTQGQRVDLVLAKYAFVPIARYVRWQLSPNGSITFRVWVAAS